MMVTALGLDPARGTGPAWVAAGSSLCTSSWSAIVDQLYDPTLDDIQDQAE